MKILKVLDWPAHRFNSESHPLHRWSKSLREYGIKVEFYANHKSAKLNGADCLFIHSRYFNDGWQNVSKRNSENEAELMNYLFEMKKDAGKIIWYDAADSTGSTDFPIIHLVDSFVKKQIHKDLTLYTETAKPLRVWLNNNSVSFEPCPKEELKKIKIGWNIGLNDYRYFGYKMSRLSNYLSYNLYSVNYQRVDKKRTLDLTFRGTLQKNTFSKISAQRLEVINLINSLNLKVATGAPISKKLYLRELKSSKISISPFGWGEICYRDFETFISGAVLIKPWMGHLDTYPNIYIPNETYLPVAWDLQDLPDKLNAIITNYNSYKHIAEYGQELYRKSINDSETFVKKLKEIMD